MKTVLQSLILLIALSSCSKEDNLNGITPDHEEDIDYNRSEKGMINYTGRISMTEGPHDLLVQGNSLFAVRDHRIFKFSISNPAIPALQREYLHADQTAKFGKLYHTDSKLWIPCQSDGSLYELNDALSLVKTHDLQVNSFKPNTVLKDMEGNYWIGGSNGSRGVLAKYKLEANTLNLIAHWVASNNDSNIESMIEKDGYIVVSVAKGDLYSFSKSNLQEGIKQSITFTSEAGHEKWGHSLLKVGNNAFWANWGAGFATLDMTATTNMRVTHVLSNSKLKSQFADSEGTNVYDVAYNATKDLLCVANGWSGILLIKPGSSEKVIDFIDPTYFQNRCIETAGDYIYTGNISGGINGDLKGLMIFKIN
jgi:hypothetical protein